MGRNSKQLESYLFIAWTISVIALFGSLYFSEIRHYEPCELCWYQRILMYPLTVILGIAVAKKDVRVSLYTMALSTIGGIISLYHYSIQKIPFLADHSLSCGRIPCTGQYINWFGFLTIPLFALIAFVMIFILSLMIVKQTREEVA